MPHLQDPRYRDTRSVVRLRRTAPGLAQRGYSVTDLFLTLAIFAITVAAGTPSVTGALRAYQRNGAARHILAEIRATQSEAVLRGVVIGLQWGSDSGMNRSADEYRIVRDTTGACSFPAANAPADGINVIRGWQNFSSEYHGVTIQSIRDSSDNAVGGVMFNSMGASVNTCATVNFPLTVTVADASGAIRTIEIRSAGGTQLQ